MDLSIRWLKDYVDIGDISMRDFSEAMSMSGSKVEGWTTEFEDVKNVVVGKILSVEPHPDSDHLVICQLDVGQQEPVQIVTGASNVHVGDMVPAALHKSQLPNGVKITKGKLRGVMSNGMMCSIAELNLTKGDFPYAAEDGIFLLQEDCQVGQDIASAIGCNDTCVEFEITPNRPDCLSVLGLAREAAVTFGKELKMHTPQVKGCGGDIHDYLSVEVRNPQLCPRYTAKVVKNVKIGPSPRWMRERLRASGVRPIDNIVDITNYVMLEYGQPMHAFDIEYVKDHKIIVRNAVSGETIQTLDGVDRTLSEDMLVIADSEKASAVAGVMGGEHSGINENTHTVVFESACFKGSSVRITAKKLGMRTESSGRFEKGLDAQNCLPAVMRACELVELLGAGEVVDGVIDVDNTNYQPTRIHLDADWTNRFLGTDIPKEQMVKILTDLQFQMEGDEIVVPSFRSDVEHKADIAEEIARFYGYNNIPTTIAKGSPEGGYNEYQKFERVVNQNMLAQGMYEIMTYSFVSPKQYDKIRLPKDDPKRQSVVIRNPLGEDTSIMRTNAIPSMMDILSKNYNNRNGAVSLYEIGNEYIPVEGELLPDEVPNLVLGMYGDDKDFFTLKGVVENLLDTLAIREYDVDAKSDDPTFHPGRCAVLSKDGEEFGIIGEVHPLVCANYGINTRVYVGKLKLRKLFAMMDTQRSYVPMPKFPASTRDLALLCDDALPVMTMEKAIKAAAGKILEKIELFDVYKGSQIAEGKKSVAFNISMRASDRTLTDEEVNGAMSKILKALEELGAQIRS
ncbi:MAG: phenylalanine--tRNA ligase subunit beta [Clostridium sp.]|nr:phenylalanine--tRNA ligase subunit beta [Clostridium sp.]